MTIKKKWYQILAPEMFKYKVVGETPTADAKHLAGRTLEVNAMDVLENYSRFFVKLRFRIVSTENAKARTELIGHSVMNERIYRMVQRRGRRVDIVQDITTKDGIKLRVKSVFMLIRRVGTSIKNLTRAQAKELVEESLKDKTFEEIMSMILKGDLQKEIKKKVSKIYPTGNVEIRKTEVLEKVKAVAA